MKRTRVFIAACLLLAAMLCVSGGLAQTLCSVQELSSAVPARLQGRYKTPSGSLTVDAEIEPPTLAKQPIVKLHKAALPPESASVWPEGSTFAVDAKTQKHPWGRFSVTRQFPNPYEGIDLRAHSALLKPWAAEVAENSPITAVEASSIADGLMAVCMANMADQGYRLYGRPGATSAYYRYDDVTQAYAEQLTDAGFYHVTAYQVFHGARLFNRGQYYWTDGKDQQEPWIPTCGISADIYDGARYALQFELFSERAWVAEDVPVAAWTDIQRTIEGLIESGNIRDIASIRYRDLGLFNAPGEEGAYMAAPYWVVECKWAPSARAKVTYENEWVEIHINAQTGACLYPEDRSADRNTFIILKSH